MPSPIDVIVQRASTKYRVPVPLINAVIGRESGGRLDAVSPKGAQGLMQLMPGTARGLGVTDPYDPGQNIMAGTRYLSMQKQRFGRWDLALAAYNAGPGAVQKYGGIPPYGETQAYVRNIMPSLKGAAADFGTAQVSQPAAKPARFALPSDPAQTTAAPGFNPMIQSVFDSNNALLGVPSIAMPLLQQALAPSALAPAPKPKRAPKFAAAKTGRTPVAPLPTALGGGSEFMVSDPEGAPSRKGGTYHAGKDWFAPAGTTVSAPINGRVIEVKPSRGTSGQIFGGVVKIQSPTGRVYVFRHVDPAGVRVGARVRAGAPIAAVTAWTDGSPHTHIEVWKTRGGGYRLENMLDPAVVFG